MDNTFIETINSKANEVFKNNQEKGFWDSPEEAQVLKQVFKDTSNLKPEQTAALTAALEKLEHRPVSEILALVHSEISEALEADRKNLMDDKITHRSGIEVELADAMIRILDYAGANNLDLGGAIEEKLAYNKTRPHKHGKKY